MSHTITHHATKAKATSHVVKGLPGWTVSTLCGRSVTQWTHNKWQPARVADRTPKHAHKCEICEGLE